MNLKNLSIQNLIGMRSVRYYLAQDVVYVYSLTIQYISFFLFHFVLSTVVGRGHRRHKNMVQGNRMEEKLPEMGCEYVQMVEEILEYDSKRGEW